MSEDNVRIMAAAIEALKARDAEAVRELVHEEVEWRPALTAGGAVEGAVYRGKDGMVKYLEDVDSGFDEMIFDIERFDPVGSDRVLYRGRVSARGSASGISLDVPMCGLWEVRDGRLIRGVGFLTEEEGLEAAGLPR